MQRSQLTHALYTLFLIDYLTNWNIMLFAGDGKLIIKIIMPQNG